MKKRMILTMATVICCLLTVSLTAHAVFTYSAQTGGISIQMASFSVKTQVQFADAVTASTPSVAALALDADLDVVTEEPNILDENDSYKFPGHGTATFTLTPTGTAGEGYVVVTIEGKGTYYTGQISKDNSYTFSITAEEGTMIKIESVWGKYCADSADSTANAEIQLIEQAAAIELITAEKLSELTATPTVAPTISPSPEATPTVSPEPTVKPTATPTVTPEATLEPTASPEATVEPTATVSPSPEATVMPTPTPVATTEPTASQNPEAGVEPTPTPTVAPEATVEPAATPTAAPVATTEPTATTSSKMTATPEATVSPEQTIEPEAIVSPSPDATM